MDRGLETCGGCAKMNTYAKLYAVTSHRPDALERGRSEEEAMSMFWNKQTM